MTGARAIDRYRLIRRIKPSGTEVAGALRLRPGELWLAEDNQSAEPLQVVLKHTGNTEILPAIVQLLRNEQLRQIAGIVPLLDYIVEDGEVVAVTPFLPEGTLAEAMAELRLAPLKWRTEVARCLLGSLSRALNWLDQGNAATLPIAHNDLKPDNIFVSGTEFLLGDFDNSLIDAPHRDGGNPGGAAARYAPPERFGRGYTVKGDCWSLGMLLAEVLLGGHPFDGGDGSHLRQLDSASLPEGWQLASAEFLALPRDWQALLYGLTTTRTEARWGKRQLQQWHSNVEADREAVIDEGLELGKSKLRLAKRRHKIGSVWVRTVEAAAEQILRCQPTPVVADPAALADWIESEFNRTLTAGLIRQTIEIEHPEVRHLRIALVLDRHCQPSWRGIAISRRQIAGMALDETEEAISWIESLRSFDPLATYAAFGNEAATALRAEISASQSSLEAAWREMQEADCPVTPPSEAALWRIACQTAFSPNLRLHYLERLGHLAGASTLFARPAWISRWCSRFDELSVEQLQVIEHVGASLPRLSDVLTPVKADAIPLIEGTDAELDEQPIIWLKTQDRLLGRMRVADVAAPQDVNGGDYYPESVANFPYYRLRNWLRTTLYPWAARRLGRDPASRLRRAGLVGDAFNAAPALRISATVYQTQAAVEEVALGPTTYACEIRWFAPEGYDVRLVLTRPGLFRDSLVWKTPLQSWVRRSVDYLFTPLQNRAIIQSGLTRRGRMALSVCQTLAVTLVVEPRVPLRFRPSYASAPIIIVLPKPELTLHRTISQHQYRTKINPTNLKITRPQLAMRKLEGEIAKPQGAIGASYGRTPEMFWERLRFRPMRGLPRFAGPLTRLERWISRILGSRHHRKGRTWKSF